MKATADSASFVRDAAVAAEEAAACAANAAAYVTRPQAPPSESTKAKAKLTKKKKKKKKKKKTAMTTTTTPSATTAGAPTRRRRIPKQARGMLSRRALAEAESQQADSQQFSSRDVRSQKQSPQPQQFSSRDVRSQRGQQQAGSANVLAARAAYAARQQSKPQPQSQSTSSLSHGQQLSEAVSRERLKSEAVSRELKAEQRKRGSHSGGAASKRHAKRRDAALARRQKQIEGDLIRRANRGLDALLHAAYAGALRVLVKSRRWRESVATLDRMVENDVPVHSAQANAVLEACVKNGRSTEAMHVLSVLEGLVGEGEGAAGDGGAAEADSSSSSSSILSSSAAATAATASSPSLVTANAILAVMQAFVRNDRLDKHPQERIKPLITLLARLERPQSTVPRESQDGEETSTAARSDLYASAHHFDAVLEGYMSVALGFDARGFGRSFQLAVVTNDETDAEIAAAQSGAIALLDEMRAGGLAPTMLSYNFTLAACAVPLAAELSADWQTRVGVLLGAMRQQGVQPNSATLDWLARGCASRGEWKEFLTLYEYVTDNGQNLEVELGIDVLSCKVEAYVLFVVCVCLCVCVYMCVCCMGGLWSPNCVLALTPPFAPPSLD